jgi:hypothetical protein
MNEAGEIQEKYPFFDSFGEMKLEKITKVFLNLHHQSE